MVQVEIAGRWFSRYWMAVVKGSSVVVGVGMILVRSEYQNGGGWPWVREGMTDKDDCQYAIARWTLAVVYNLEAEEEEEDSRGKGERKREGRKPP